MCLDGLCDVDLPRADRSGLMRGWKILKPVWNDWGGGWSYLTSCWIERKPPIKYHAGWNISRASYRGEMVEGFFNCKKIIYTTGYHVLRYKDSDCVRQVNKLNRDKRDAPHGFLWLPVYYKQNDIVAAGFQYSSPQRNACLIVVTRRMFIKEDEYEKAIRAL